MKKNNYIFALLLACATMTFNSCSDLEPVDYAEINPSNFPKTESDIESLVYSCYYPLRGSWWDGMFSTSERGIQFLNDATTGILTGTFGEQKKCSELNYFPETTGITWFYYTRSKQYSGDIRRKLAAVRLCLTTLQTAISMKPQNKSMKLRCAVHVLSSLICFMICMVRWSLRHWKY